MASTRGLDDLPPDFVYSLPPRLREAFVRRRRAGATLRLYRRRGWNPSAVLVQLDRATADLQAELDALEDLENNPRLF